MNKLTRNILTINKKDLVFSNLNNEKFLQIENHIRLLKKRLYYLTNKNELDNRKRYLVFIIQLLNDNLDKYIEQNINKSIILLNEINKILAENKENYYSNFQMFKNTLAEEIKSLKTFYSTPNVPITPIDNNNKIYLLDNLLNIINDETIYNKNNINLYINQLKNEIIPNLINNLNLVLLQLKKYPISDIKYEFINLLEFYSDTNLINYIINKINKEIIIYENNLNLSIYREYQNNNCLTNNCFVDFLNIFQNQHLFNEQFKLDMMNKFNNSKNPQYIFNFSNIILMNKLNINCKQCLITDITIRWNKNKNEIEILETYNGKLINTLFIQNNIPKELNIQFINDILTYIFNYLKNSLPQKNMIISN